MARTLTFTAVHIAVAFGTTYALTGNLAISGLVTFVEPVAAALAMQVMERVWPAAHGAPAGRATAPRRQPAAAPALASSG